MKKHYRFFGVILGLFAGLMAIAQPQNAMDFDGNDDFITAPSATSTVAGAQQMSVSCWVNPQFTTHHEGFCGFRNNTNADFYLLKLQYNPNPIINPLNHGLITFCLYSCLMYLDVLL